MKIAHIGAKGLPSKGGTERVLEAIAERMSHDHELTVYCDARYTPADVRVPRVRLIRIPTIRGKHAQASFLFLLSAIHALLFGRYDLVHLHSVEASFVMSLLKLRFKVVATAHGTPTRCNRSKWGPVARTLLRFMEYPFVYLPDRATSVSKPDAEYLVARYGRPVMYVPNGVETPPPHDPAEEARVLKNIGVDSEGYILFAAGRIDPTKGCHLVIEAFKSVETNMQLVVLGDLMLVPTYGEGLQRMADRRVTFVPPISDKRDVAAVVRHCRIFVFPSITEGMSMMLLEAASLGVPLVCSDIVENTSVLGERALYFRSGDAADLAQRLSWAVEHPDEMRELSESARKWVYQNYLWDSLAGTYQSIYESVVRGKVPAAAPTKFKVES